jgi:MoaA/NifB/PqqE/SkfB family radical SAM enzyme
MRFNNFWCYRRILFSKGFAAALWNSRKNLFASAQGLPLQAGPYMAELDITYRCNCRCQMCQRWNDQGSDELSLSEYRKLAGDLHAMGSHQISIAGGEPLMREDVFPLIENFTGLGMSVNLCTNGLLVGKYGDQICASGIKCITISLDGASAESHDRIRGFSGSYNRIEEGIQQILQRPASSRPILRVRMTVSAQNANEIRQFYEKWHRVADDVLLQPVHHCADARYTGMNDADLKISPGVIAEQIADTPLKRDEYIKRLLESLETTGAFPRQPCYAAILMARIDPWGNVYPCLEQHVRVGSIRENDFPSIWNSKALQQERTRLASNRSCSCWYNNTALIGYYGHYLSAGRKQLLRDLFQNHVACRLPTFNKKKMNIENKQPYIGES